MKLFENTKSKLSKDKNDENVPRLETTEEVLVYWNISAIVINKIQESCINLLLINCLLKY